jgi:hypothetical protein
VKIEIGESLVYSWLRHVMHCQVVQTNWKPSPKWPKEEIDFEDIKDNIQQEFLKDGYIIFKKTASTSQFLQQAEIDAVGFSRNGGSTHQKYYFVDVAFHEGGLNYGSKEESISRILKKFTRSYFIFLKYFPSSFEADIYFITPKMSDDTILTPLEQQINKLTEIFKEHGFSPNFQLLVNQDFKNKVLIPTTAIGKEIADTSELFLRSFQLWNMFNNNLQPEVHKKAKVEGKVPVIVDGKDPVIADGIGKTVRDSLSDLINNNKITNDEVENLLDHSYCKEIFDLQFPFLRRIKDGRIISGHARYYAHSYPINGEEFYLCNHWYKHQLEQFEAWKKSL